MSKEPKTLKNLNKLSDEQNKQITHLTGPLGEVNEIADQLAHAITDSFDFTIQVKSNDPIVQKLSAKVNTLLATIRGTIGELEAKNETLRETARTLQESEIRFRSVMESASDAIVLADSQGTIIFWNNGAQTIFGYTEQEVLGQPLAILMPERYRAAHQRGLDRLSATGESTLIGKTLELYGLRQDSSEFPLELTLSTWQTDGNTFYSGIIHDITERKQAEKILRQNEERFREVVSSINAHVYVTELTKEGRQINRYISPNVEDLTGYPMQKFLDDWSFWPSTLIHPEDRTTAAAQAARFAHGEISEVEYRLVRADGRVIWVRDSGHVQEDPISGGHVVYGFVTDTTERKEAEERLEKSNSLLNATFEAIADGIVVVDLTGQIVTFNQTFVQMWNMPDSLVADTQKRHSFIASQLKDPDPFWQNLKELSHQPEVGSYDILKLKDGRVFERHAKPHWLGEKVVGRVSSFRDISQRKQLERKLQDSLERRQRQVQLSAQVAQAIATIAEAESLYQWVVTQIAEQFGFYHTQLFHYQPDLNKLVLMAGHGERGKQMLAEGGRLREGMGLISLAAATSASILRPDVSADPNWQGHPLLPDTKGEIAVPIKLGKEDAQVQIMALKSFIQHGFDGLVVTAIDLGAARAVTAKALAKGIPVVSITHDLGQDYQTALVHTVEREMGTMLGRQAGEWATQHIPPGQTLKLGLLNYRPVPQVKQREDGIIEGIKAIFGDNIEIVGNETAGDALQAWPIAVAWLQAHPDLNMIVGYNDATALGAYQAVIAAGKDDPRTFFVGGIDATPEALAAIRKGGAYQATVDIQPRAMGRQAIQTIVAALKGRPYRQVHSLKCTPVNLTSLDEFLSASHWLGLTEAKGSDADSLAGLDLRGLRIGLSVLNLTNPFFATVVASAKEEAERLGIELVINDPKRVLGVLNVQSSEAGLLDVEDQLVLEGIAAQIAAAIESTSLRQGLEDRVRELNALQRLLSQEGWQTFQATRQQATQGYLYDQKSIRPATIAELRSPENGASQEQGTSATPITKTQVVAKSMAVQGEIIGSLGVQSDPDNPLAPEDQTFLDAIAEQVAEALERARLLEQTQSRAAEMEAVAQVSAVVSTILAADKLLQEVVDLTKERFGLYHAHIYLLNEAGDSLKLAAGAGDVGRQMVEQEWSIPLAQEQSLVAQAARTRQTVMVNDVRQNPNFLPNSLLPQTRSEMAVPMIVGHTVLGVLDVQDEVINRFSDKDIQVQTTLATQIAVASRNASLFQQTQMALAERESVLEETENLYEASRRLNEARELPDLLAVVAEGGPVSVINRALLFEFKYNSLDELEEIVAVANWHSGQGTPPSPLGTRYARSVFTVIDLFLSVEPIFFDDAQHDERMDAPGLAVMEKLNIRTLAVLPLQVGARQWGVLILEGEEPYHFSEREAQPYVALARQLAIALDNRRLLAETQTALAEVEAVQRRYTIQAWEAYQIRNTVLSHEEVREGVTPLGNQLLSEISPAIAQERPPTHSALPPSEVAGQAADGRPQLIDGDRQSAVSGQLHEAGSNLIVPLTVRGEAIGVLGMQETDEVRQWLPEEIDLVVAIAEQFAQTAETLRLIDETQQRVARERRVNEIGEKIQGAQSLEEALKIAIKEVGLSLQAPQTNVQLEIKN